MTTRKLYLQKFHFPVSQLIEGGKTPAQKGGFEGATNNPEIAGNAGAYAGGWKYEDSYIVVVDLDNHPEIDRVSGVDYWREQRLPVDTLTVKTPRDGLHLYFFATADQLRKVEDNCSFFSLRQSFQQTLSLS